MPYAISVPTQPGVASYQLGAGEEWQLQKLTASVDNTNIGNEGSLLLDTLTPSDRIIDRQLIAITDQSMFVSLGFGAEAITTASPFGGGSPAGIAGGGVNYISEKLPLLTLIPGCTLNLYYAAVYYDGTGDPFAHIDTGSVISDVLLWVEDTNAGLRNLPDVGNPILLGVGG